MSSENYNFQRVLKDLIRFGLILREKTNVIVIQRKENKEKDDNWTHLKRS